MTDNNRDDTLCRSLFPGKLSHSAGETGYSAVDRGAQTGETLVWVMVGCDYPGMAELERAGRRDSLARFDKFKILEVKSARYARYARYARIARDARDDRDGR